MPSSAQDGSVASSELVSSPELARPVRLVIISGRSGSGKSTALHVLEDVGYTCIDNLPAGLLPELIQQMQNVQTQAGPGGLNNSAEVRSTEAHSRETHSSDTHSAETLKLAVGVDARNLSGSLDNFPQILANLRQSGVNVQVVFLDARASVLIRRFSETRRRHPLSSKNIDLKKAMALERELLDPVSQIADRQIDTSNMTLHQLRDLIKKQVVPEHGVNMAVLFQSFGFKRGVPVDADFMFDVRCLPNPHWKNELRPYSGNDKPVIEFLESQTEVAAMLSDIIGFLTRWIPRFNDSNRSYLTVAVGCTGGQHRSVYLCNRLGEYFAKQYGNVLIEHRELDAGQVEL